MNFKEFTEKELIGRTVLISTRYSKMLRKIEKVSKTTFKVAGESQPFKLISGRQNGGNAWNSVYAELITDEKANEIRAEWKENKEKADAIKIIENSIKELPLGILNEILKLIPTK